MSYYDNDTGEYVGFDPVEYAMENRHKEKYHKSEVPSPQELFNQLYYQKFIDESKEYIGEHVCEGDEFMDNYLNAFAKIFHDSFGDINKTMELIAKDRINNKGKIRYTATDKEHITRRGTESYLLHKDGNVIGVFYDKDCLEDYLKKRE